MRFLFAMALFLLAFQARAFDCQEEQYLGLSYLRCQIDPSEDKISLHLKDEGGENYGSISALRRALSEHKPMALAMNGGMYHEDGRPVGLYIEKGKEFAPLVTQRGPGNFGLLPNGVFCASDDGVKVVESLRFERENPQCQFATQSGPMLVIDGELHPRFLKDSDSRFVRNGVGVKDGQVYFVISKRPVSFYEFGSYFRDQLGTPNALYLDGKVSQLYRREGGGVGFPFPLGPILVVGEE